MNEELGFSYTTLNDSYGVSSVTLGFGCIIFVPFAMRFGRRPVYLATTIVMLITAIWSARIQTEGDLMGTNVLMGLSGAVNETLFQMTVSDLFFVHQRGTLNGLLLIFGTLGNYFGPVAAGYCATSMGWRWPFWFSAIFLGVTLILLALFLEESKYIPPAHEGIVVPLSTNDISSDSIELAEKARKEGKGGPLPVDAEVNQETTKDGLTYDSSADPQQRRYVQIDHSIPKRSLKQRYALWTPSHSTGYPWWRHLVQPFILFLRFPAVAFAGSIWAFCLSALSVVAVSQSDLLPLPPYNFSAAGVGLTNVGSALTGSFCV